MTPRMSSTQCVRAGLLHALINGRSPIDGARGGHTAERIDGDHIRSTSWTCRYTNNDNGLGKSNEKGQDRSSAPLLRALNQTAVAFVPLSPCNQIGTPDGLFLRTRLLRECN